MIAEIYKYMGLTPWCHRFLSDTWVLDLVFMKWRPVMPGLDPGRRQFPAPRVFAASCSVLMTDVIESAPSSDMISAYMMNNTYSAATVSVTDETGATTKQQAHITCRYAYLFGGTNGSENFGDLWLFRPPQFTASTTALVGGGWEQVVPVGPPPSPRYGHRMVALASPTSTESSYSSSGACAVVVIGGCSVSPKSEIQHDVSGLEDSENKELFGLSSSLQVL